MNSKWKFGSIPPEYLEWVLIWTENNTQEIAKYTFKQGPVGYHWEVKDSSGMNYFLPDQVIAWMELPDPPRIKPKFDKKLDCKECGGIGGRFSGDPTFGEEEFHPCMKCNGKGTINL